MKLNEMIEEWHAGIRINVLSHYECSKVFENYHRLLGYPAVILSALAGTAFVSSLDGSSVRWERAIAILLSLAVTVLASLQTFLRYSERSEKHKKTATEFGKLRRELEQIIVLAPAIEAIPKTEIEAIRIKWGELSTHAPSIPNEIYTRMYHKVLHRTPNAHRPPAPTSP